MKGIVGFTGLCIGGGAIMMLRSEGSEGVWDWVALVGLFGFFAPVLYVFLGGFVGLLSLGVDWLFEALSVHPVAYDD